MSEEQLGDIIKSLKSKKQSSQTEILELLYQFVDVARTNDTDVIHISDIREIIDEL